MAYSAFRHIDAVFLKDRPIHLTFFLTRRCNARCPFCFYLSPENVKRSEELSLDEIKKISSSFGNLIWLAFSGGEIFLRKDLVEITRVFYEKNKPAIILLPTNGLLPDVIREKTGEILKSCGKSTVVVKLSLEGPESVHDSIRGKGSFQKTLQTYDALRGLLEEYPRFELGVNSVFCSANQDSMDKLIDFVATLGNITTHTVSMIRGSVSDESLKHIDLGKYSETAKKLETNLRSRQSRTYRFRGARLKAAQDILQRRLIRRTIHDKRQLIPCYAGKLNLVLSEDGDIHPCESFAMKMGNVRQWGYDIQKLLRSERARRVLSSIRSGSCFCTHECYFMTNILFNPRLYPALLKEYLLL
jgi:radical SAM protein with 4Fe4S-binding SPASM domain